jgi:MoaA/NifB/PqqE/SkfB family radical SAM enzyme
MNEPLQTGAPDAKHIEHEEAAHEKRNWIRLTSMCNNLCTFCLDTLAHNGTISSEEEVKARIIEGRRKGSTRLILSGGEPTIHPQYVKFIKLGRMAGYSKIQTVTNGRMFSYPDFLKRCLDAGLDEITFSIHGHNAKVHDALVGVPGAFDEEVEGLRLALADGRPIVNIDVCLNKGNIRKLPELLDRFIAMGVKEYDLLHLIPFGMAWDEKHRNSLVYDIDEAYPYIQAALKYSERPDMHIWFNRFPPPYLEGYEHLIQDPYKLNDEARGRYEEFELWITRDMPISCREPERCGRCYLKNFCDSLEESFTKVRQGTYAAYRVRTSVDPEPLPAPGDYPYLWLTVGSVDEARRNLGLGNGELVLELGDWDGFAESIDGDTLEGRTIDRVICSDPDALTGLLDGPGSFGVTATLTANMAAYLLEHMPEGHPRLTIAAPNYERMTEATVELPDMPTFFAGWTGKAAYENIPECVSGHAPVPRLRALDSDALRKSDPDYKKLSPADTGGRESLLREIDEATTIGDPAKIRFLQEKLGLLNPVVEGAKLDLFGFSRDYIRTGYYSKSLRCRDCARNDVCEGLHISTIRAKGYSMLQPITDASDAG